MDSKTNHLYFGVLPHQAGWEHAEREAETNPMSRDLELYLMMAKEGNFLDLTRQIFVLAPNKEEAQRRIKEHFGYTCEMRLDPNGMGWVNSREKIYRANGVYGSINWRELEECPECEAGIVGEDLRHDASTGTTECARCGWELSWTTGQTIEQEE